MSGSYFAFFVVAHLPATRQLFVALAFANRTALVVLVHSMSIGNTSISRNVRFAGAQFGRLLFVLFWKKKRKKKAKRNEIRLK